MPPDAHSACADPPGAFSRHVRGFGNGAPQVGQRLHMLVGLPGRFVSVIVRVVRGGGMHIVSVSFADTVRAKTRQTFTSTSIILASPRGDCETMQEAYFAYSIPHAARRK